MMQSQAKGNTIGPIIIDMAAEGGVTEPDMASTTNPNRVASSERVPPLMSSGRQPTNQPSLILEEDQRRRSTLLKKQRSTEQMHDSVTKYESQKQDSIFETSAIVAANNNH